MTRCPYSPINGRRCPKRGRVLVVMTGRAGYGLPEAPVAVCAEHAPRYLNNGWTLAPKPERITS